MSQLPTKSEILDWISENPTQTAKRDIAKAFNIKGADRIDLASRTEPASAPPATATGRIDPVHLDAEADRAGSTSSPHRVRA